jgi:integrating conjugative element protein (TIGR03765 family)
MKYRTIFLLIPWALSSLAFAEGKAAKYADIRYREEDMLPARSTLLTPGPVERRPLDASGLPAFFLIGDDPRSRAWLKQRLPTLIRLNAVGLVINVESKSALDSLRQAASGVTLTPVSADDLAQRLNLKHYPALITSNSLEQ